MSFLIHIPAFSPQSERSPGAVRRSIQICTIADQSGRRVFIPVDTKTAFSLSISRPLLFFEAFLNIIRLGLFHFSFKGFFVALIQGAWLAGILKGYPVGELWIEVAAGRSMILAALLGASGRRYVAYPHNIEFLVPRQHQSYFAGKASEFYIEYYVYSKASQVQTISSFDSAVVSSLGISSVDVLPYSPTGCFRDELLLIRKLRETTLKNDILILGSVENIPTLDGMRALLRLVAKENSSPLERKYQLAGYGTEILAESAPASVHVLGSVSTKRLRELMATCKCLLVMQPQTSGIITRLAECELAGIPIYVLGDYIQANDPSLKTTKRISSLNELP